MVKGGRLIFKGGAPATASTVSKGKGKNVRRPRADSSGGAASRETAAAGASSSAGAVAATAQAEEDLRPVSGTGRLSTSGTTVHGHGTAFMRELMPGDAVMITHPTTLMEETRIVKMVLSDSSMGISSAFSSDLVSTTAFRYITAPRIEETTEQKETKRKQGRDAEEKLAFGTYAGSGGSKVVYRVKKAGVYGGYEIITADAGQEMSREELLQLRSKKKADRHCY